jgi:hypothetical protein
MVDCTGPYDAKPETGEKEDMDGYMLGREAFVRALGRVESLIFGYAYKLWFAHLSQHSLVEYR